MRVRSISFGLVAPLLVGCHAEPPPPAPPPPPVASVSATPVVDAGLGLSDLNVGGGLPDSPGLGDIGKSWPAGLVPDAGPPGPSLRQGALQVSGRLPPEVVQRIVRQSFGKFRLCYERGLKKDKKLEGVVTVEFTIDRDGAVVKPVMSASAASFPDQAVASCIVHTFDKMSFPQPEGGDVKVVYPLILAPPPAASAAPARRPALKEGAVDVTGKLDPEGIKQIVRQNYDRFSLCYQDALRRTPGLSGNVTMRFTIDASGRLLKAENAGSSISDSEMISCVINQVGGLQFTNPAGGTATVVYPIQFSLEN